MSRLFYFLCVAWLGTTWGQSPCSFINESSELKCVNATLENYKSFIENLTDQIINAEFLDCSFPTIQADMFDYNNFDTTKKLYLNKNNITSLTANAFSRLRSLEQLSLANNSITTIQPGSFFNLLNLKDLNLSFNKLSTIGYGVFTNLPLVEKLHLFNNGLQTLDFTIFEGLPSLVNLDLYSNNLSHLDGYQYLKYFSKLQSIGLHNNFNVSCKELAELKLTLSDRSHLLSTTDDWFGETNVSGIRCKQS